MPDEELRRGERPDLEAEVAAFLAAHPVVTLAVADASGPWAAAVFFASDGFDLYFVSSPRSRHAAAIAAGAPAAATIQGQPAEWRAIRGVQLSGRAGPAPDAAAAAELYAGRFPFVRELYRPERGGFQIAGRFIEAPFYRLAAREVWWIDNAFTFGQRRHIALV